MATQEKGFATKEPTRPYPRKRVDFRSQYIKDDPVNNACRFINTITIMRIAKEHVIVFRCRAKFFAINTAPHHNLSRLAP